VRMFTAKQIHDLYEVRKTLEGLAIRLAVLRLTEEDLELLRAILHETQEALERDDMPGYSTSDQRFHSTIARLSENEILIESLGRLQRQIQLVRIGANQNPEVVRRTALERPRILSALEMRDAALAAQLMEEHIEGVRRSVIEQIAKSSVTEEMNL
jgi:DNA-binding GntR family transcriptional regulator